MEISREEQIKFAREILALTKDETADMKQIAHLKKLVSLLHHWTNGRSGIVSYLDEYIYELTAVARGEEDNGWKDEFKKKLLEEIESR